MPKITVWTEAYRPFIMGGDCNRPVATEVEASGLYDIGHDFKAYRFTTPKGRIRFAESTSGAIIGDSLDEISDETKSSTKEICVKQITEAKKRGKYAEKLSNEEFFKIYDR